MDVDSSDFFAKRIARVKRSTTEENHRRGVAGTHESVQHKERGDIRVPGSTQSNFCQTSPLPRPPAGGRDEIVELNHVGIPERHNR
jgi:hypothetical protein